MDEITSADMATTSVLDTESEPWLNLDYAPRAVGFGEALKEAWAKKFVVRGRASQSQYWWLVLGIVIAQFAVTTVVFAVLFGLFYAFLSFADQDQMPPGLIVALVVGGLLMVLWMILYIGMMLVSVTAGVRRLHDSNRSGWWILTQYIILGVGFAIALVVFIAGILNQIDALLIVSIALFYLAQGVASIMNLAVLVFQILPGTQGPNRYGPGDQRYFPIEQFPNPVV